MNFLKKFDENISFKRLFLYWLIYLAIGISIMSIVTPIHPSFAEQQTELVDTFCQPINLIFVSIAFLTETFLFMFLPWKIWKKKGLVIGLIVWSILHLIGNGFPIFLYICVKALFYYRLFEIGRVKEAFGFHFLINLPGILTCL